MNRKILYISGTRADYGLMYSVLKEINNDPELELEIAVTGMHLMDEFGMTLNEIKKDGFKFHKIDAIFENDDKYSMASFIGKFIQILSEKIKSINPDFILLLGDRAEMLGGAIVGNYLSIPVVHIHGGDVTSTVDEHARHAITKLSHVHFPATEKSASRIKKMGENDWRIHITGSPAIDSIAKAELLDKDTLAQKYKIDLSQPILLVVQHPVTIEADHSQIHIKETLDALAELEYQTIIIYPNADAGGRNMIEIIKEFEHYPFIQTFQSLPRIDYLSLMNIASIMIGNSSSGIVEAPYFKLPVINLGERQKGRERAANIIDCDYDKIEIMKAANAILNENILDLDYKSPYGVGETGTEIVNILKSLDINDKLLQKELSF